MLTSACLSWSSVVGVGPGRLSSHCQLRERSGGTDEFDLCSIRPLKRCQLHSGLEITECVEGESSPDLSEGLRTGRCGSDAVAHPC